MRFTSAAFLAFAASAFAQTSGFDALTTPTQDESIPAGQAYTINWQPGTYTTGTVTLSLLGGATPSTLLDLGSFASGIQNSVGTYTWTVDSSLGDAATYGIKITLDSDSSIFQYSFPFHISASAAAATTSSSAVVVTTATGYPTSAPAVVSSTVATYSAVEITSSAAPTTVVASTSAAATTVSSVVSYSVISSASTFATAAPSGNGTYTASTSHGATTLTSATTKGSSSTSSSATATASVVTTNGAGRAAAGSFALVAAVAAAFLI